MQINCTPFNARGTTDPIDNLIIFVTFKVKLNLAF